MTSHQVDDADNFMRLPAESQLAQVQVSQPKSVLNTEHQLNEDRGNGVLVTTAPPRLSLPYVINRDLE